MCTLSWVRTADSDSSTRGYHIHFNRDESYLRSAALPPQVYSSAGIEFLAPIDQDAMGTWIFVNSWGFSACLLNNYIDVKGFKGKRSRGLLVKDLSHVKSVSQALELLSEAGVENYSPFDLYLFDMDKDHAVSWNGVKRRDTESPTPFKTSSGFADAKAVMACREQLYMQNRKDHASLREFHKSHIPGQVGLFGLYAPAICEHPELHGNFCGREQGIHLLLRWTSLHCTLIQSHFDSIAVGTLFKASLHQEKIPH